MKRFKSFVVAACAVLVAAAYIMPNAPASAASSAALSIVPKKNYTVEPGKSVKDTLVIRNIDTTQSLELSLRVVDFTFMDDTGTPKLMLDEDAPQTTWSLKPFLTVPKTVTIEPNSSKTLDMSVTIPKERGGGSLYSAIVYSSGASDGGNVGLSASGVTLVFANIPGDVTEDLKLENFGAYSGGKYVFFATTKEPQSMAYTLKNNGNVTEAPVGSITLRHMFGKEYTINDVNPNSSLALIGQSRTFTPCIQLKSESVDFNGERSEAKTCSSAGLWPGFYTASLDLYYGQNGNNTEEISGNTWFFYLPWWFILVSIIVLLAAGYYGWRLYNNIRNKLYGPKMRKTARRK